MQRLARLEQSRSRMRPCGAWPPILPHNEWEVLAIASQETLIAETRDYLDEKYPVEGCNGSGPMDVSHRYKTGAGPHHVSRAARAVARGSVR